MSQTDRCLQEYNSLSWFCDLDPRSRASLATRRWPDKAALRVAGEVSVFRVNESNSNLYVSRGSTCVGELFVRHL